MGLLAVDFWHFLVEWTAETASSQIDFKMLTQRRQSESFQCQLTLVILDIKAAKLQNQFSEFSLPFHSETWFKWLSRLPNWIDNFPDLCPSGFVNPAWRRSTTIGQRAGQITLQVQISGSAWGSQSTMGWTARLRHIRIVWPRVLMSFQDFTPFDSTFNTFYEIGYINAVYDCITIDVAPNVTGINHAIWCTYDMMREKEYIELEILRISQIETFHRGRSWW